VLDVFPDEEISGPVESEKTELIGTDFIKKTVGRVKQEVSIGPVVEVVSTETFEISRQGDGHHVGVMSWTVRSVNHQAFRQLVEECGLRIVAEHLAWGDRALAEGNSESKGARIFVISS